MKNKNDLMAQLRSAMHKMLNYCGNCGSLRTETKFEDLPSEAQNGFKPFRHKAKFKYCQGCDEYSMQVEDL